MALPIASVQLYSLAAEFSADMNGSLEKLAAIGLRTVEAFDFVRRPKEIRSALDQAGLTSPTGHAPLLTDELWTPDGSIPTAANEVVFEAAAEIGMSTVIEPMVPTERWLTEDGVIRTELRLFRSGDRNALGDRVPVSEIYSEMADSVTYPVSRPLFQYFKPDITNSVEELCGNVPLGQSCFETCADTLRALDVAFDSFAREFILGKKRIIVPSSCVQTIIDPETGETKRYFDADDEAFQALKCDEDKDLHIQDNTMVLRIQEHIDGINALLNILCFQVGLSAGTLSFDRAQGMKTATEIISEESKTAQTIRCNKNLLVEFIEGMCGSVLTLAMETGEIPRGDYELSVSFRDGIIIDDNTLIDNNIKLVSAGLKSKISAIMEVLKCDEETARQEYEKIISESRVSAGMTDIMALSDKEE